MTPICFLDVESTGLGDAAEPWEIALIRRDETGEHEAVFFVDVDLSQADPTALRVGGFYDRHPLGRYLSGLDDDDDARPRPSQRAGYATYMRPEYATDVVARLTHGCTVVAALPTFDTPILARFLRAHGLVEGWPHRVRCIESVTEGHARKRIGGLRDCLEHLGLDFPEPGPHTALGDARAARAIWDHIMTADPLAGMAR